MTFTNLFDVRASEAAMALDVTDLPVGTFVKWTTDEGYSGRQRVRGVVESITAKNYVVWDGMWDKRARIPRDADGQHKRQFEALLTPEEYTQAIENNKAEVVKTNEEAARKRAEKAEQDRQDRARRKAEHAMAEDNPYLFQPYLDKALSETT